MGRNITYKILDNLPIKVVVGAYDTSATICWKYSATICEDGCNSATTISTACENKPIEPNISCESTVIRNGTITWNDKTIAYTIEQLPRDCEKCGEIAIRYELTDYWLVPSVIYCDSDPNSKGKLYFEYYEIQEDDCQIISKKKKLGESAFTYDVCDNVDETVHKEKNMEIKIPEPNEDPNISYAVVCEYDCAVCTSCTPNSAAIVIGNITYDKDYVLCSGTTAENPLNCTINYSVVQYDSDCKKHVTNKIKKVEWVVANCKGNHTCCEDHFVITSETIEETVGEQTLTATASLSILMKSNFSGIDADHCDSCDNPSYITTTKYCTSKTSDNCVSSGVKVYYKTLNEYNEYEWLELKNDKSNAVPREGGQIKVEFPYTAYTTNGTATPTETLGTDSRIITVRGIDVTCDGGIKQYTDNSFSYNTPYTSCTGNKFCNVVTYSYFQHCKQGGGGGGQSTTTIQYASNVSVGCEAQSAVIVPYTATTTHSDGTTTTSEGSSSYTISITCNDGDQRTIEEEGFTITQAGGCNCSSCEESNYRRYSNNVESYYIPCAEQKLILNRTGDNKGKITVTIPYIDYQISPSTNCEPEQLETGNETVIDTVITELNTGETYTLWSGIRVDNTTITIDLEGGCVNVVLHIKADKEIVNNETQDQFTVYYWAEDSNHNIITEGVTLEDITQTEVEADERLVYSWVRDGVSQDGKPYKVYNSTENDVNRYKYANFKSKYGDSESEVLIIEQPGRDMTILPDFDYLTFTFSWAEEDGKDFDTATYVEVSSITVSSTVSTERSLMLSECPVGYDCEGSNDHYSPAAKEYIQYGGDNVTSGDECALINWKKICNHDFISEGIKKLYCNLYGNWYEQKYVNKGYCTMTMKTYKGDSGMYKDGYVFKPNEGTELVSTKEQSGYVYALGSRNTDNKKEFYSYVAQFIYYIKEKYCVVVSKMKPLNQINGREIRGYMTVAGTEVEIKGNGRIYDGKTITNARFTTAFTITSVYNVVDGERQPDVPYKRIGVPHDSFATATFENNTLSIEVEPNTTSAQRSVSIEVIFGNNSSLRQLEYYYIITQEP